MRAYLDTAGERVAIDCAPRWIARLIAEGAAGRLRDGDCRGATLRVRVEATRRPFATRGWEPFTRGGWRRDGEVVVENACTAGFDVHVGCAGDVPELTFRWRPPPRDRCAAWVARSRFHLLARAVLIQYPPLWWAGTRGRAPLHASACRTAGATPLLTAASGVGRSTLLLCELEAGERATGDNLAVGDGRSVWGLVEPLRVAGGNGRRMPHGRREAPLRGDAGGLAPDCLIALERGQDGGGALQPCSSEVAARSLVTSTYMAGELRRFWTFAATLAAGTGVGPAHPPVGEVAAAFAARLACMRLTVAHVRGRRLGELLATAEVAA
jgi:hypothetical protein